ncbi:MAG: hypothetical protein IPI22_15140 [Bacteroidetes bacterium]|nr:hypothetical protein [Bacteroidota bacterium]
MMVTTSPFGDTMTQAFYDPKYATREWKAVRAVLEGTTEHFVYTQLTKEIWTNTDRNEPPIADPGFGYRAHGKKGS